VDCFGVMMEHRCDVYGPGASGTDAGGGVQLTWPTVRTADVPFLLNVSPAADQDRFAQKNLIGPVTGATFDTSVRRGDKLVITAGPSLVGVSLHITALKVQPGVDFLGFSTVVHVTCEQVV
jgi:hypothetical protein